MSTFTTLRTDDELVVENSPDPECALARVLRARGIGDFVTIIDGATGKPRSRVNIAKAAEVAVREGKHRSPHFAPWTPFEDVSGSSPHGRKHLPRGGQPRSAGGVRAMTTASPELIEIAARQFSEHDFAHLELRAACAYLDGASQSPKSKKHTACSPRKNRTPSSSKLPS